MISSLYMKMSAPTVPTSVLWGKTSLGRDTVKVALIHSFEEESHLLFRTYFFFFPLLVA